VIRASQGGNEAFYPAAPVQLVLTVNPKPGSPAAAVIPPPSDLSCNGLLPVSATHIQQVSAANIVSLLGAPTPFVPVAQGSNKIFIYSSRRLARADDAVLRALIRHIRNLARQTTETMSIAPPPFSVELKIPHALALGDLATRLSGLNYSALTVQDVGSDNIRITATAQPDCPTWSSFLNDLRQMERQVTPAPLYARLFSLPSASDVSTTFSALSSAGGSTSSAASTSSTPSTAGSSSSSAPSSTASSTPSNATVSVSQPPGSAIEIRSDTTPCVVIGAIAGLSSTTSPPCAPSGASSSGATSTAAAPSAPSRPATPPALAPNFTMSSLENDLLVFAANNPGNDAQIQERERLVALLDLPRPEVIINAWVMQNSTTSSSAMGAYAGTVRDLVVRYNKHIEDLNLDAWHSVKAQMENPEYFNQPFYDYVTGLYIADGKSGQPPPSDVTSAAQAFLDNPPAMSEPPAPYSRRNFRVCERNHYCLGYVDLFKPLKPRLTDVILALIAAQNPLQSIETTLAYVQGPADIQVHKTYCRNAVPADMRERCTKISQDLGLDRASTACDEEDLRQDLARRLAGDKYWVHLKCFHEAAARWLSDEPALAPSGPDLIRAAIANFLFHYKMSQQFPHEFAPYELSQSADTLNSALAPLIDAFNQDLAAYQRFMRADVQYEVKRANEDFDGRCCIKRLFSLDKPSFFNDGVITVRTISGQPASVNTTSQSYLNASTAPTLSALLSSIAGSGSGGSSSSSAPTPGSTTTTTTTVTTPPATGTTSSGSTSGSGSASSASSGNPFLSLPITNRLQAISSLLSNYQSSYAQIGRQISITATPQSLATASGAVLSVTLNVDDAAGTPLFTGPAANDPAANISRVSQHDTTTQVRVESIKLFEVSSFSAIVQRSHSRFPLLPPFVEIPYIGTIAGIPLPAAKEYHDSTAILSAMVVPTAADIAYGIKFNYDEIASSDAAKCGFPGFPPSESTKPCGLRRAVSMQDFKDTPVRNYHQAFVSCLATHMQSTVGLVNNRAAGAPGLCQNLSFDTVAH
jgi:hypothetical protein